MKIGILTFHRAVNYGAFLQAYCLATRLNEENDVDAEIIDYEMESARKIYDANRRRILSRIRHLKKYIMEKQRADGFQRGMEQMKNLLSDDYCCTDSTEEFKTYAAGKYDAILCGSDEVWRPKEFRPFPNPYFLPGETGCRKLSYAACGRTDYAAAMNEKERRQLAQYLAEFEVISVRDKMTYTALLHEGIGEEKMMLSCDPSFLAELPKRPEAFYEILKGRRLDPGKKNLLLAGVNHETVSTVLRQLGEEYNVVATYTWHRGCINAAGITPFEWRELITAADLVITSLFHGVCFSITSDVPFIAVVNDDKAPKICDLLGGTEFEECIAEEEQAENTDWKALAKTAGKHDNNREFVLRQRAGFEEYLRRLRGAEQAKKQRNEEEMEKSL